MLTVPQEIKDLLHLDTCHKNIRIHFPNGERSDICNNLIVQNSVKFTESLCSHDELKFGLCESSVFEFETVGVGNIKGDVIEVFCEIYCDQSVSGSEFKLDIQKYVFSIPYGSFIVDSCKRQADLIHRKVVAYGYKQLSDLNKNEYVLPIYNSPWYANENLVIKNELLEMLLADNGGTPQSFTNRQGSAYPSMRYSIAYEGVFERFYAPGNVVDYDNPPTDVTGTRFSFAKYNVLAEAGFDINLYLSKFNDFYEKVRAYLGGVSPDVVENILWFCRPHLHIQAEPFVYANYGVSGDQLLDNYYTRSGKSYWQYDSKISEEAFKKSFLSFEIDKRISKTASVCEYAWTQGIFVVYLPTSVTFRDQYGSTYACAYGGYENYKYKKMESQYDASNNTDKTAILIPRNLTQTASRQKVQYSGGSFVITDITRTEYLSSGDYSEVNLMDFMSSSYELQGLFGRKSRVGGFDHVDIQKQFGLNPDSTLYPGQALYPEGVTGGSINKNDYQSCWYDDQYTKPFGAVQCVFKDTNNDQILYIYYLNGYSELSDAESYLTYDISDNYFIKTNTYTANEVKTILETLADQLEGITYMPVDFVGRGLPYVEAGDTFEILTRLNDSITTIVLNKTTSGEQTLTDSYKSV